CASPVHVHLLDPRGLKQSPFSAGKRPFRILLKLVGATPGACAVVSSFSAYPLEVLSNLLLGLVIALFRILLKLVGAIQGACAFLVQLQRLAPRGHTQSPFRAHKRPFRILIKLVGAIQGACAFLSTLCPVIIVA